MTAHSLQTNLTPSSVTATTERRFVHLSQPVESGMDKTASMYDISQMVARARSGQSAFTYKKNACPAGVNENGGVDVRLDFEAWPSSPNLAYTLSASIGEISLPTIIDEYTEFSVVWPKSDVVELGFILSEMTYWRWEVLPCSPDGRLLSGIVPEMDGLTTIRTGQPVFGVLRVRGKKVGARHLVNHTLIKSYPLRPDEPLPEEGITPDDLEKYWAYTDVATWNGEPVDTAESVDMSGLSLENLAITITARWLDAEGEEASESMQLTVPQCVQDLLAVCDGDLEQFGGSSGTSFCDLSDRESQLTVYVSGCNGKVIEERKTKEDPDSWCE